MTKQTAEDARLATRLPPGEGWKKWAPNLSERQWGMVREDYSPHGSVMGLPFARSGTEPRLPLG
jgi:hypothetical protein